MYVKLLSDPAAKGVMTQDGVRNVVVKRRLHSEPTKYSNERNRKRNRKRLLTWTRPHVQNSATLQCKPANPIATSICSDGIQSVVFSSRQPFDAHPESV